MTPLLARLRYYADLEDADVASVLQSPFDLMERPRGATLIEVGDELTHVFVVNSGWAMRHRTLDDGRRQIVNLMLPGDCFDLQALIETRADHTIESLTALQVLRARREDFLAAVRSNARLSTAFWWAAVQEESILREQIVRLGRRSGPERVAHFLLELHRRLAQVDLDEGNRLNLPVGREIMADLLGLSVVHVSRSLRHLRNLGLVAAENGAIRLRDLPRLAALAQFDPSYLHERGRLR